MRLEGMIFDYESKVTEVYKAVEIHRDVYLIENTELILRISK
jgi:hypothetical protein